MMDSHTLELAHPHPAPHPAPCGHLVQIYSSPSRLLDTLETFIATGLDADEAVIVIATAPHLHALESRLQARGMDLLAARHDNRFLPIGTDDAMARFIDDGWPDAGLFEAFLAQLMGRARGSGRKVRAFGEMVAVLWAQGNRDGAVQLERLWSQVCEQGELTLLCAYPDHAFGRDDDGALATIRRCHTGEVGTA
jgi:hypothetical protein